MASWKSTGFLLDLETSAGADPDLASPGAEAIALEVPLAPLHGAAVVGPKTEFESMKKPPFFTVDQVTKRWMEQCFLETMPENICETCFFKTD